MTLEVWSARISTGDRDAFNVTRKSGNGVFAPSWTILRPILDLNRAKQPISNTAWQTYCRAYLLEMSQSYRINRGEWDLLLARERVVLCCYCTDPTRCHRTVLGKILAHLGGVYYGELEYL